MRFPVSSLSRYAVNNAVSIVGTKDRSLLQTYSNVWSSLLKKKRNLIINPIYKISYRPNKIILRREFPSESFKKEFPIAEKYLPKEYIINGTLSKYITERALKTSSDKFSKHDALKVEDMMKKFILTPTPEKFY